MGAWETVWREPKGVKMWRKMVADCTVDGSLWLRSLGFGKVLLVCGAIGGIPCSVEISHLRKSYRKSSEAKVYLISPHGNFRRTTFLRTKSQTTVFKLFRKSYRTYKFFSFSPDVKDSCRKVDECPSIFSLITLSVMRMRFPDNINSLLHVGWKQT